MGLPIGKPLKRIEAIYMTALVGGNGIWMGDYTITYAPRYISTSRYYIPLSGKDRLAAMQAAYRLHELWRDGFGVEVEITLEGA